MSNQENYQVQEYAGDEEQLMAIEAAQKLGVQWWAGRVGDRRYVVVAVTEEGLKAGVMATLQ